MSKSNIQYKLIKTTAHVEDSGLVATYGISCCMDEPDGQRESRRKVSYDVVPDISNEPDFVEALVDRLNAYGADPGHLRDLVEDCLP